MRLPPQTIRTLLEAIFWGSAVSFTFILGSAIGSWFSLNILPDYSWLITRKGEAFYIFVFALLFSYLYFRDFLQVVWKVIKSSRFDIFIAAGLSALVVFSNKNILSTYIQEHVMELNSDSVLLFFIIVFILSLSCVLYVILQMFNRRKKVDSKFANDNPIRDSEGDLLDFSTKANSFAENIFHASQGKGLVFGVDAPWGSGKSSFLNLCKRYWEIKHKNELIVYEFSPLHYSTDANLLERFVDGLIKEIQKNVFIPEIRPLFSQYSKLIKIVNGFSIFGVKIPEFASRRTINDVHNDLECALNGINRRIIVIVDDLDRIELKEIKNVLFAIRESFKFPNISYVLCYDTENINALEADTPEIETVNEFLEKFVNIKISIFLDKKNLENFVSKELKKVIEDKTTDPELVAVVLSGLRDIFQSPEFHRYTSFVGDIRKLKRLVNTVVLLELYKVNFDKADIDKFDLAHLLLIYINYPSIFRKIYNTETAGGYGFFSAVGPYDSEFYPKDKKRNNGERSDTYENSDVYNEYLEDLTDNQKFLIEQIFNVTRRLKRAKNNDSANHYINNEDSYRKIDSVSEDIKTSLACFNGDKFTGSGRNLEDYLRLIAHLAPPEEEKQFAPFKNWRDKIISEDITIEQLFNQPEFSVELGEQKRQKLWRLIVNNTRKLNQNVAGNLIRYLTQNISKYSLFENEVLGVGLRHHDLPYFLVRLLNDAGYKGSMNGNNTEENIKEIADWIFGEDTHKDEGILDALLEDERGILGLYDSLSLRLICCSDRGGDIFNVSRAIAKHGNKEAPTAGDTRIIVKEEMREISQKIFGVFKSRYIDKKINIFSEVQKLSLDNITGEYSTYVRNQVKGGVISEDKLQADVEYTKFNALGFIVYQLGDDQINHGVGCGLYDPLGNADKGMIKNLMNKYLFERCFNPTTSENNYENLLSLLLRNIPFDALREDHFGKIPDFKLKTIVGVLDIQTLSEFWKEHREKIKKLNFENSGKKIFMGTRYVNSDSEDIFASYQNDLPRVYKALDDYIDNPTGKGESPA